MEQARRDGLIDRNPRVVVFGADAGAFAALGGQHVGVAGVGVAPAQEGGELLGRW